MTFQKFCREHNPDYSLERWLVRVHFPAGGAKWEGLPIHCWATLREYMWQSMSEPMAYIGAASALWERFVKEGQGEVYAWTAFGLLPNSETGDPQPMQVYGSACTVPPSAIKIGGVRYYSAVWNAQDGFVRYYEAA